MPATTTAQMAQGMTITPAFMGWGSKTLLRTDNKLEDRLQNKTIVLHGKNKAIVFALQKQSVPKRRNNGSIIM